MRPLLFILAFAARAAVIPVSLDLTGVGDNAPQIQAALDANPVVALPVGKLRVNSTLFVRGKNTLIGESCNWQTYRRNGTCLIAMHGGDAIRMEVDSGGAPGIENIGIDAYHTMFAANPTNAGVRLVGHNLYKNGPSIRNCVINMANIGLAFTMPTGAAMPNARFRDLKINSARYFGVWNNSQSVTDDWWENTYVEGKQIDDAGIWVLIGGTPYGIFHTGIASVFHNTLLDGSVTNLFLNRPYGIHFTGVLNLDGCFDTGLAMGDPQGTQLANYPTVTIDNLVLGTQLNGSFPSPISPNMMGIRYAGTGQFGQASLVIGRVAVVHRGWGEMTNNAASTYKFMDEGTWNLRFKYRFETTPLIWGRLP